LPKSVFVVMWFGEELGLGAVEASNALRNEWDAPLCQ
jgi:hypothetical protein